MRPDDSESSNPYEKLSPKERNEKLKSTLERLPRQLVADEPQLVENLGFLNDLTKQLEFSNGTKSSSRFIIDAAAYSTEFGVESLSLKPEEYSLDKSFPGVLFDETDPEGLYGEAPQRTEQRGLLFFARNRLARRGNLRLNNMFMEWWAEYTVKYNQDPSLPIDTQSG